MGQIDIVCVPLSLDSASRRLPAFQLQLAKAALRAAPIFAIMLFGGCAKNRGPATREYLKTEHDIVGRFMAENGHPVPVNPPTRPTASASRITKAERQELNRALKAYSHQLIGYYSTVISSLKDQSSEYSHLQAKMGSVSAADVEPEAVALIAQQQKLIGDSRIVLLNAADLFDARRTNLVRAGQSNLLDDILIPGVIGFAKMPSPSGVGFALGALQGFAKVLGRDAAAKQEIAEQYSRLKASIDDTERDGIEYQTARSQMLALLSSKHPELDWGFLQMSATAEKPPQ